MNRRSHMWTARTLSLAAALVFVMTPLVAQDSAAKVIYQVGQVSISDGYMKALSVGDIVKVKQLIVTGPEGYARFEVLSDHSTFEVFPNAKVVFRSTPGAWDHLLEVFIGRVKVFIQHAPGVDNPNKVTSPTAVISVRGTVFDVLVEDTAGTTFVTVDEGVVDVRNTSAAGPSVTLRAGDSIHVYPGQPLVAAKVDKGNILRRALYVARDAYYQIMIQRPVGGNGPIAGGPGSIPGNGDKGKDTGTTTAPGAPPAGPGAPPAGPGAPPAGPGQ